MVIAITLQFFDSNHLAWLLGFQCSLRSILYVLFFTFYLLWKKFPLVKRDNFASWTTCSVERWGNSLGTKIVVINQYKAVRYYFLKSFSLKDECLRAWRWKEAILLISCKLDTKFWIGKDCSLSATETKFSYVRFLLNNKDLTLLGNNVNFFSHTVAKTAFSAVRSWPVEPKIGGHLGAAKTA